MQWLLIVSAILGAMSQVNQASAQREAAKKQEAAAQESRAISEQNAQAEEAGTQEALRKQGKQHAVEEAAARAAAAASGFGYATDEDTPSSIALSLAAQKTENKKQRDYAESAGRSRADIIRRGGSYSSTIAMNAATSTRAQAAASTLGAFGSLFKAGSAAYQGWGSAAPSTEYDYWDWGK